MSIYDCKTKKEKLITDSEQWTAQTNTHPQLTKAYVQYKLREHENLK